MTLKKKKMKKTTTLNLFTVKLFIIIEFIYSSKRISESMIRELMTQKFILMREKTCWMIVLVIVNKSTGW